jgi:hypothetical protein
MDREQERANPDSKVLDEFIQAYEAAQACGDSVALIAFLPKPDNPLYRTVLRELVRLDLEFAWERGQP